MVLRDEFGNFVMDRSLNFLGCMEVDVGEAHGFLKALSWIKEMGLEKVMVKGDAKIEVNAIKSDLPYNSVNGDFMNLFNHPHF
ncbi:hypothetical protein ACS0TY_006912 [Phlomoides rotata]